VPGFLAELYVARADLESIGLGAERILATAEQMTLEGTPVRCVRSIFVPEDETCLLLYEGASLEAVQAAGRRANLPFERVTAVARAAAEEAS
jgi:hypothetical protein